MASRELLRSLTERFPTPFYVYDLSDVSRNYAALGRALPEGAKLLYSLKANPLPAIARRLRELGARAEVSSPGELSVALGAEFAAEHMLYTGPAKTSLELELALDAGVRWFSLESAGDFARLAALVERRNVGVKALLRLNPNAASDAALAMTGVASQFGFEEAEASAFLQSRARRAEQVAIVGVHVFFGTQLKGVEACASALCAAWNAAMALGAERAEPWQVVDLGGGFPWAYACAGQTSLAGLAERLSRHGVGGGTTDCWFESGRYLVASAGTLVTRVTDVKISRGKKFVLLDSGINHLGGMAGLGRLWRPQPTLVPLADDAGARERIELTGPLCTTLDSLGAAVDAPLLKPDDFVAIPNTGAYGLTASLTGFLSRPTPLELVCDGSDVIGAHRLRTGHEVVPLGQFGARS
jgi:diaminopimelate decarboxylase